MFRFYTENSNGEKTYLTDEPVGDVLVARENLNNSKIFTLLITVLLGIALVFMGLDLDLKIVFATIKVTIFSP